VGPTGKLRELRAREYRQRLRVNQLRRDVYERADPAQSGALLKELIEAEKDLREKEKERAQLDDPNSSSSTGLIFSTEKDSFLLGEATTGLRAQAQVRMAQVPTSIYHLLTPEEPPEGNPLVTCWVKNATRDGSIRRVRIISFIEGYSARAIDTAELEPGEEHSFNQLPALFLDRVRGVTELTRAALNVVLEDIDNNVVELHKTETIWLLARSTAPLRIMDPTSGEWQDTSRYFGAFVTPNAQSVRRFLRVAADNHPGGKLRGYQGSKKEVELQVRAVFAALKSEADIRYVNSVVAFSPEEGSANQRVRLPRESLEDKQANCIDGTVLFASLLEGISLSPAIVVVPGHTFVAWETWDRSDKRWNDKTDGWKYLETTMIGSSSFEEACGSAEEMARRYQEIAQNSIENGEDDHWFRLWPLRELRSVHQIMPME
jgi:hypothetical protein